MMRRLALVTLLCASCATDANIVPLDISVVTPDVWSGSEVLLRHGTQLDSLPSVMIAAPVDVRRLDDSTIAVRVPDTNGTIRLMVSRAPAPPESVSVRVYGFVDIRTGPAMRGAQQPRPALPAAPPQVITDGQSGLALVNVQTLSSTPLPGVHQSSCGRGPSPGYVRRVALAGTAAGDCNYQRVFRFGAGGLVLEDSIPLPVNTAQFVYAAIGPATWIQAGGNSVCVLHASAAPSCQNNGSFQVLISPRGDRAVAYGSHASLVFDSVGAGVWSIVSEQSLSGLDFTAGGDTLFAALVRSNEDVLVAFNATTGAELASAPSRGAGALAIDPNGKWIYLFNGLVPGRVDVHDRLTLARVATLIAGEPLGCPAAGCGGTQMLIDQLARQLILVFPAERGAPAAAPSRVLRFDLMP